MFNVAFETFYNVVILCVQDISHVLADIFKDLYTTEVIGKYSVSNLKKSLRRDDSNDKYVEELQQVSLFIWNV